MSNSPTIQIPEEVYRKIHDHLLPEEPEAEEAAMVFAQPIFSDERLDRLEYLEWYAVDPSGFSFRSLYHFELSDKTRAYVIKRAHDLGASIIEFHSHPYPYDAVFSWSDLSGFEEFVPHVWWRLKGKPYAAVVVAPSNIDALIWYNGPNTPEQVNEIVIGDRSIKPTRLTMNRRRRDYEFWNL